MRPLSMWASYSLSKNKYFLHRQNKKKTKKKTTLHLLMRPVKKELVIYKINSSRIHRKTNY